MATLKPPDFFNDPTLILNLRNERPIASVALGELFATLGNDYRRLTGGQTLFVAQIEYGSIDVWFREVIDLLKDYSDLALLVARASRNLSEFFSIIHHFIDRRKSDSNATELFLNKRRAGVRSAEKLVQMAIAAGGEVELQLKTQDGDEMKFRFTSTEAIRIRDQAADDRLRRLMSREGE